MKKQNTKKTLDRGRFAQVLEECLDRISTRDQSIEACLADFPEHAGELESYLRIAVESRLALRTAPSPQAVQEARQRFDRTLAKVKDAKPEFFEGCSPSTAVSLETQAASPTL